MEEDYEKIISELKPFIREYSFASTPLGCNKDIGYELNLELSLEEPCNSGLLTKILRENEYQININTKEKDKTIYTSAIENYQEAFILMYKLIQEPSSDGNELLKLRLIMGEHDFNPARTSLYTLRRKMFNRKQLYDAEIEPINLIINQKLEEIDKKQSSNLKNNKKYTSELLNQITKYVSRKNN
jgi:hypothetical protein